MQHGVSVHEIYVILPQKYWVGWMLRNAKELASNSKLLALFSFNLKKIILSQYVKKVKFAEWLENNVYLTLT